MTDKFKRLPAAYFLFIGLVIAELATILFLNQGFFTYSLDDPYIHLAMSENLIKSHYGINLIEFSAPSSSILWPLFLAPLISVPGSAAVPLILNIGISLISINLLKKILTRTIENQGVVSAVLCFFVLALNMTGLVYTGMEHSLQLMLSIGLFHGLLQLLYDKCMGAWLIAGILLGPLVRYENLALSAPACLIIFITHSRKDAVILGVLTLLPLIAFSCFLHKNGLGLMPSSVLAKSDIMNEAGSLEKIITNLKNNLFEKRGRGLLFAVSGCILLWPIFRRSFLKEHRFIAFFSLAVIGLHMLVGRMGWFSRYEIYAWAITLLGIISCYPSIFRLLHHRSQQGRYAFCIAAAVVLCPSYLYALLMTPLGCNNIYEQQYQMHRFLTEFWKAPIAANDIGYISFRNPNDYILDIWGLGSYTALKYRDSENTDWMNTLAKEHNINMAVVYPSRTLPENWTRLAVLNLGHRRTTVAEAQVGFYSINSETAPSVRAALEAFSATLPPKVKLVFE